MKTAELKRLLKQHDCYRVGEYTGHEKWYSPITGNYFPVPRHDSQAMPNGTLNRILKDAGIKQ